MANQAKGKATLATKKTSKVASKKPTKKLSRQLAKSSKETSQQYRVFGIVLSADAKPAAGLTVLAYDNDVANQDLLGQAVTDAKGAYAISYTEAQFKRTSQERGGADIVVSVLNAQQKLLFTSKKKNNAPAKFELNIQLPQEQFTINGVVKDSNGEPQHNIVVRAYDRDLRKEQLLGKANTAKEGSYAINYTAKDFVSAEGANAKPDLLVKIYSDAKQKEPISTSEVRFNANRDEVFDFTIAVAITPEFEQISSVVLPILKNQNGDGKPLPPNELTAADIDFIVKDTGLDQAALSAWVAASTMQKDALARLNNEHPKELNAVKQDGWPFFYAFARQGYADSLGAVLLQNAESWNKAWQSGVATNRVAETNKQTLSLLTSALSLMLLLEQLDPAKNADNPFAKVLSAVDVNLPRRVALAALDIVQQHGIDKPDELLKLLKTHPGEKKAINTLVRGVRVNNLVSGDAELFKNLNNRLNGDSDSIAPLASLATSEWIGLADKTTVSKDALLRMQANVENLHPVTALQARLDGGQLEIKGVSKAEVNKLIKDNGAKVEAVMQGRTFIKSNDNEPDSLKALQGIGQYARTGINIEMAGKLLQADVKSPAAAVKYGQAALVEMIGDNFDIDVVGKVVNKFLDVVDPLVVSANAFLVDISNQYHPYGVIGATQQDIPPTVSNNLPDVAAIFGDLDGCMCRPCESMLGLPAYLVDLLNFLKKFSGDAFGALSAKRHDIADIPLSCEKADKVIMHIEIVFKILSDAVGGDDPYLKTASAIYPWKYLPYQRERAETKVYLDKLAVSRFDLLTSYGEISGAITAETLNLSMDQTAFPSTVSEWKLLTEIRSGNNLWAAYGFDSNQVSITDPITSKPLTGDAPNVLRIVSVFLDRTGLTLDELDSIVASSAAGKIGYRNRGLCKTSEMLLDIPAADREAFFDKAHRFVRLKNKIPEWTIVQLHGAVESSGGLSQANQIGLLNKLAAIKRLCDVFYLPVDLLLEVSTDIEKLPRLFGLSKRQWDLLKAVVGINIQLQVNNFDWDALERYSDAIKRITEAGLTIEQVAEAKLTREQLINIYGALPANIKTDAQIEKELTTIQERLSAVVVVKTDVSFETQTNEALTAIFDANKANKIIKVILAAAEAVKAGSAVAVPPPKVLSDLLGNANSTHILGDWHPLLTTELVAKILGDIDSHNADERFQLLLKEVAKKRRERELVIAVTELSGLPEIDVIKFLNGRLLLDDDPINPDGNNAAKAFLENFTAAKPRLFAWLDRISRLVVLSKLLALDSELMRIAEYIFIDTSMWRDAIASTIPAKDSWSKNWRALLDLILLQQPEQLSRLSLNNLLGNLTTIGTQNVVAETLQPLATRFEVANDEVLLIAKQAMPVDAIVPYAKTLRNPTNLRRIFNLLLLAFKIKANSTQLTQLVDLGDNAIAAATAKTLFKTKVGEQAWNKLLDEKEKVLNPVRQQSRDALVAYLVRIDNDNLRDANDLYEKYLIDPKIEPCFETTRLLEAVTATQLFIQRIFFGLEPNVFAGPVLKQRWTWMRNYRVWEANRKVFLFPENWLYPELRDDKSFSFNLLESALGQGELTKELAEEAFGQFLDDVAQMGQIEVLGMYEDISRNPDGSIQLGPDKLPVRRILYVVGRTPNPPYAYYWRKCIDFGSKLMEWSPWQRIELDIQGDHVMPFVLGGSFHIAWPIIKYNHQDAPKSSEWEIKLAWSRYDGRVWRKSSISREAWKGPAIAFTDERRGFAFRCKTMIDGKTITILGCSLKDRADSVIKKPDTTNGGPPYPYSFSLDTSVNNGKSLYFPLLLTKDDLETLIKGNFDDTLLGVAVDESFANIGFNAVEKDTNPDYCLDIKKHLHLFYTQQHFTTGNHYPGEDRARWIFERPVVEYKDHMIQYKTWSEVRAISPSDLTLKFNISAFITKFLSYPSTNTSVDISFNKFLKKINSLSSLRNISYKAWIKINTPTGGAGFREASGDIGDFTCIIGGVNYVRAPNSTAFPILKLGTQLEDNNVQLKLTLNQITLFSKYEKLSAVDAGFLTNPTIHFELNSEDIQDESARAKFISDLGIDLESEKLLVLTSKFEMSRDNAINITDGDGSELVRNINNALPWMNGYQEKLTAGNKTAEYPIEISGTQVLVSSPPSQFWVVGSATTNTIASNIWHFSDSGLNAYVDLNSSFNSELLVYADSYKDATQYRVDWLQEQSINQPDINTGSFSTRNFPSLGAAVFTSEWVNVTKGNLAFDARMPYACYNWEVFFHAPLMIADQLSKQHKFEEAERWLRHVFDPTDHNTSESDSKPFFKFKVFKELDLSKQVIDDLTTLAKAFSPNVTSGDVTAIQKLIERWRDLPFRPFVIARRRHIAFLWRTLFAYLDNLIAWADSLFRRDTRESINEAVMLYVLIEQILGRRPQQYDGKSARTSYSYNDLNSQWDDFANAWVGMGANTGPFVGGKATHHDLSNQDLSGMLYFCMPFNDKILSYWNVVDDRLFNVRHCLNIEGIERKLPFTDPTIDPELLIRATAAGLDLGDVISGLYAPPPHYRYGILSARAAELANEAKSLGAAMLSAMEKRDAEQMALLRSTNEISMLKLVKEVRTLQITEAERNLDALRGSRKSVCTRFTQYQHLLGKKDIKEPSENESVGEESMLGNLDGATSQHSSWGLIKEENEQYIGFEGANTWSTASSIAKIVGSGFNIAASVVIPNPAAKLAGAHEVLNAIALASSTVGDAFSMVSQSWRSYAEQQGMMAGHIRRRDEWAFQSNQTLKELQQIDKQILANEIRIAITKKELDNHIEQIEQTQAMDEVMRSKFSNVQLYEWMSKQLYSLYDKTYRMALDMARRAERAAARELGVKPLNVLKIDYWDSLRMGLLAGERLHHDLKRLEIAYLDQNRREFELTKHISLRRLDPEELLKLRFTKTVDSKKVNSCDFNIPEWLFDLDTPGHYLRRIKSVSVSIPCVVGPYTSINCKLTLQKSSIRHDKTSTDYHRTSANETRYTDYYGASEAIVTSTASGDSGMFETQLRDERFLPFEGSGVISTWQLELPADYPQFDYSTISDVILSIRYTARDGGLQLRDAATDAVEKLLNPPSSPTPKPEPLLFPVLLTCKSDFPTEWAKAKANLHENLMMPVTKDLIPYWMDAAGMDVKQISHLKLGTDTEMSTPVGFTKTLVNGVDHADLGGLDAGTSDVIVVLYVGK